MQNDTRPLALYPLLLLHLFLGISALFGGWMLLTAPDSLGANPDWLQGTPFHSFLIPGLILFIFNGLFPLFI